MSITSSIKHGLHNLSEGWHHLRERAGHALTHFQNDQPPPSNNHWGVLAANLEESGNKIRIMLEIPGMERDDFDVKLCGDMITISGEKKTEQDSHEGQFHVYERAYGHFQRNFFLPVPVDSNSVKARYKKGVLTITLEKSDDKTSTKIKVEQH